MSHSLLSAIGHQSLLSAIGHQSLPYPLHHRLGPVALSPRSHERSLLQCHDKVRSSWQRSGSANKSYKRTFLIYKTGKKADFLCNHFIELFTEDYFSMTVMDI